MPRARSISGSVATNVVASAVAGSTFYGFSVNPAAAGTHTVTFFDNATTSSGTILYSETATTVASNDTLIFNFSTPIKVVNGVTATIATTAVGDITVWLG